MNCDKTKETCADYLIPHERPFILVIWQEEWLMGNDPFYLKFLAKQPVGVKTPISIDIRS